jgi:PAS domain S-box-containing protein
MGKRRRGPDAPDTRSAWPSGGGEVGRLIRAHTWEHTPLGSIDTWPPSLRWATELVLASAIPRAILWGNDLVQIYNDSFCTAFMGDLHPAALGQPTRESWPEVFPRYAPYYARVLDGESLVVEDVLTPMQRDGHREDVWITITCTPLREDSDIVAGIFISAFDTTQRHAAEVAVRASEERQAFLLQLSDAVRPLQNAEEIKSVAARILGESLHVDHVYYAEVEFEDEYTLNPLNYYSSGAGPDIAGRIRFADYNRWVFDELRAAHFVTVGDVQKDKRFSEAEHADYARYQVQAFIAYPLVKSGRLAAVLGVTQTTPHTWTREDAARVEETAERTWAAVERAIAEAQLAADLKDTQLLCDLGARLVTEGNSRIVCQEILSAAIALSHADAGTVQILDHATQTLVLSASQGFDQAMTTHFYGVDASSRTSCGQALASGERTIIDFDVPEAEDPDGSLRLYVAAGYRSGQSTPLVSRSGQAVGMVSSHWRERHHPGERELRYLDLLARQAADVIERFQSEVALRESEERFRAFVDLVPDLLWRRDTHREVTWYNQRWIEYTGQAVAETHGTGGLDFIHPDDREDLMANYLAASESGRPFLSEYRIRRTDGTYRWFLAHAEPVHDADGQIVQWYGAATDVHERRAEREEMTERVAESTAQLRALTRQLLQVQEDERRHLARELHDEIGQVLTGLQFQLASAVRQSTTDGRGLAEAETIVRDLTRRVSALSMDLRPAVLDSLGLLPALLWYIERYQTRTGVTVHLRHQGIEYRFAPTVEITAYRVIQEALTNIARHAEAHTATIHLLADHEVLTVVIRDDGIGFVPAKMAATSGLDGMRERVALLGGNVVIESEPGSGTSITCELPLRELESTEAEAQL